MIKLKLITADSHAREDFRNTTYTKTIVGQEYIDGHTETMSRFRYQSVNHIYCSISLYLGLEERHTKKTHKFTYSHYKIHPIERFK